MPRPIGEILWVQRQRGGVNDNPNVAEFTKNTQAIRVMNSMCHARQLRGNCRESEGEQPAMCTTPLPKRHCTSDTTVIQCQPITDAVVSGMLVHFLDYKI